MQKVFVFCVCLFLFSEIKSDSLYDSLGNYLGKTEDNGSMFDSLGVVNTPLAAGSSGSTFRAAVERDWLPALEAHQPDIVFVSAGFDAHVDDPLADLRLVEEDYRWVTQFIVAVANQYAQGRVVSTLEGGYDLDALARSVTAHIEALA